MSEVVSDRGRRYRHPAVGRRFPRARDMLSVMVSFQEATFAELRALAVARGVSFSTIVRELVEGALLDREEAAGGD